MRKRFLQTLFIVLLLHNPFSQFLHAQTESQKLTFTILLKDSLFWSAYNNCDTGKFQQFFTSDIEFYHDKGGLTLGLENLAESIKKNLCSNNNFRLRREAVPSTVRVFPLQKSNVIYGAVISGDHVFYIIENGKEKLDGLARFTHLWLLKDSVWKMARIISYDHGPAPSINRKKEMAFSNEVLDQYTGKFKGATTGLMAIDKQNTLLILSIQNKKYTLYPERNNHFFVKDRELDSEFVRDNKNRVSTMLVRENGQITEEAVLVSKNN